MREEAKLPYLYQISSQNKRWRFAIKDIKELRKHQREIAKKELEEEGKSVDNSEKSERLEKLGYLTLQEEQAILTYHSLKAQSIIKHFKFNNEILITCLQYFKRFYLSSHLLEYNIPAILFACLYLAIKSENRWISVDKYAETVKVPPKEVLRLEYLISQKIEFDFKVYKLNTPLNGIVLDYQRFDDSANLEDILKECNVKARKLMYFDTLLLANPSQLALALFDLQSQKDKNIRFDKYLKMAFEKEYPRIREIIDQLKVVLNTYLTTEFGDIERQIKALRVKYYFIKL
ncbi:hypothetical protein K502DRAFT_311656 [Neoconidiobolus thromboides FSU 785]|nr:hypothetical protein K502DRAFT_311656 [Neoconidiobolus thromboides FSU 785]